MNAKQKIQKQTRIAAIINYLLIVASKTKPVAPLKGVGNVRCRISALPEYRSIAGYIPKSHRETVCIYRGAGYSGAVDFTSPEIFGALVNIANAFPVA